MPAAASKILSFLGLCRRAGRLQLGHDPVLESMRCGKAYLVLLAQDLSEHSAGGIRHTAEELGVPVFTLPCTKEEMGAALGKLTGAAAVEDAGFAKRLKTLCTDR
ncbi:MAG: ribosomal L7Ae/L30e/S12e/Gadd45 family protein [Oscillospiraceae bacterium]|jgi:ribosomal protein L7Ae-like RNA K-turn-binding protein|nr:ribosomal L7Ae/L30e/S12e/Gadd45 family protein [Oscillospiraceae bacterium]MDD3260590.1 ribosomal L7Ae/L30e/S12e/Gadd45 family protein [Oscillospiraceae bacterium]